MALGADRLMAAKLGEAEGLAAAGLSRLYLDYPLVGPAKQARLTGLLRMGTDLVVAVDSPEGVAVLEAAQEAAARPVAALVEVDTGFGRVGLADPDRVLDLARRIAAGPVRFLGLSCFGGQVGWRLSPPDRVAAVRQEDRVLDALRAALTRAGLEPEVVSRGGTPLLGCLDHVRTATELRPGTYIYHDVATVHGGAASWGDCAAVAVTTVVSTPATDRAVVDAGSKTLAGDGPIDGSFGYIRERPDLALTFLSEEHGVVRRRSGGPVGLRVGDVLTVVPNHVCTMINLHDAVWLEGDAGGDWLPVAFRGAVR
jgi:D-serine deaminase-like pyridoxal phosphate-dependent protein